MEDYIGLTKENVYRSLIVARKCYQIAINRGHNEKYAKMMFLTNTHGQARGVV